LPSSQPAFRREKKKREREGTRKMIAGATALDPRLLHFNPPRSLTGKRGDGRKKKEITGPERRSPE